MYQGFALKFTKRHLRTNNKAMSRFRSFRFLTALIVLAGMLFAQLAVASYRCPGMTMETATASSAGGQSMANCAGMDRAQPGLCSASAQKEPQSLGRPDSPQVPPFALIGLALAIPSLDAAIPRLSFVPQSVSLSSANGPPLAIRHCCFRI
ncbi:MAG TPA: hypothetical protein VF798_00945 [Burkholderiaceae bacterium]